MHLRNRLTIPIKGFNRSVVYDLTRKDYHFIPNSVYENLHSSDLIKINDEYLDFLEEEEIIFEASEEDLPFFPELSLDYKSPYDLVSIIVHSNSILEYSSQFQNINVENVSIIFDNLIHGFVISPDVEKLLLDIEADSINIYLTDSDLSLNDQNFEFLEKYKEVFNVYVFNEVPNNQEVTDFFHKCLVELNYIDVDFQTYTSNVFPSKFSVNKHLFIESKNTNAYYNRKLYIDETGNISNGINTEKVLKFSELKSFKEILKNRELTARWSVDKDKIPICNQCEFRNMCIDPRELSHSEVNSKWYYKSECRYNPFISKWLGEEGYLTLEECNIRFEEGLLDYEIEELNSIFNKAWANE